MNGEALGIGTGRMSGLKERLKAKYPKESERWVNGREMIGMNIIAVEKRHRA